MAAAITALMTGAAYATSARTAARMGPFAGFHENAEPDAQRAADAPREVAKIDEEHVPTELLVAAQEAWDTAVELAEVYGVRNSQATRARADGHDLVPHGLRHDRHRARPRSREDEEARRRRHDVDRQPDGAAGARRLGYSAEEIDEIVAYIDEHKSIIGAPQPEAGAPPGLRLLDGGQRDPLPRPREDDGGRAAVHLRVRSPRRSTCPRTSPSRTSSSCTSTPGGWA